MGQKINPRNQVNFKFIFSDDYNPKYANGAIGGVAPTGEIVINFYQERAALPNEQTFAIDHNSGSIGEEVSAHPADYQSSFVRFVQAGITLDVNKAKDIHHWLGEQISIAEAHPANVEKK